MTISVFAFASASSKNIWAGVGAQMWAIPDRPNSHASSSGKAANLPLGSFGLLYNSLDKCFTVPFVVLSKPDPQDVVTHVWQGRWVLPFRIRTLGTPHDRFSWENAKAHLPPCVAGKPLTSLIHVAPLTVFAASKVEEADWSMIIDRLAN